MKIIFNTFKYGNARTKFALLLMAIGLLAGFGLLTYSLIVANYVTVLAALLILVADVGFILSTDFKNLLFHSPEKKEKTSKKKSRVTERDEEGEASEEADAKVRREEPRKKITAEDEDGEKKKESQKAPDIDLFKVYDQKKYKQILVQYKVKQDHELILIDNCRSEMVFQCPAILWKDKTTAYILLIEAEPRMIKYNMYDYNEMHIRVGVDANPAHEYMNFKESTFLGKLFTPLLPNYTSVEDQTGRKNTFKKALYGIGPDIYCTSNSVKNILKVLSLNMVLTESKIQKGSYSDWFKRIYISRLMYRDKIFSAPEYQAQVLGILDQMAEKADDDDFVNSITQMLLGGLIPQEYADYASHKRK